MAMLGIVCTGWLVQYSTALRNTDTYCTVLTVLKSK
jgi:hypothetical protein